MSSAHRGDPHSVCYLVLVLQGSLDATSAIIDLVSGRRVATLKGHKGRINSIACSSDGKTVVTASQDKTVRLWRTADQQCIGVAHDHKGFVSALCLRGDLLVTGSQDKTARIWRWADLAPPSPPQPDGSPAEMAIET